MKTLDLQSKYGKPMQQLEEAMISVLSGYDIGDWFSLPKLHKALCLPTDFAERDDIRQLITQKLAAWNWYRNSNRWGYSYIRRNHPTPTKLIILANRQTIRTDASWPPYDTANAIEKSGPSGLLNGIRRRRSSEQSMEIT